jgi:hypothetical protein
MIFSPPHIHHFNPEIKVESAQAIADSVPSTFTTIVQEQLNRAQENGIRIATNNPNKRVEIPNSAKTKSKTGSSLMDSVRGAEGNSSVLPESSIEDIESNLQLHIEDKDPVIRNKQKIIELTSPSIEYEIRNSVG